jgi:hypothetical protein
MPGIPAVVEQYGRPPTVAIADVDGAMFLNLYYDWAHLFVGPHGADLLEISLRRGRGDEVRFFLDEAEGTTTVSAMYLFAPEE